MKKFLLCLSITLSFNSFANDFEVVKSERCKTKAIYTVVNEYKKTTGNSLIDARAKELSVIKGKTIYHFVEIHEFDTARSSKITVGLDIESCALKVIN